MLWWVFVLAKYFSVRSRLFIIVIKFFDSGYGGLGGAEAGVEIKIFLEQLVLLFHSVSHLYLLKHVNMLLSLIQIGQIQASLRILLVAGVHY